MSRTFTPAYRALLDELLDRGVTEVTHLSPAHLAIVLRQYDQLIWDVFTDDDVHTVAKAIEVSNESAAQAVSRIVCAAIQRIAREHIENDLEAEREQRELDDERPLIRAPMWRTGRPL